ncbi:MAG: thioesterase family protein [Acidimicrobiia bacterium]
MSNDHPAIEGFARATAVVADPSSLDNIHRGALHRGWDIFGNAHGGTMLAIAGRAMADATNRRDVVTITGHFLAPGREGPVEISTEVEKEGRQFAMARSLMSAGDTTLMLATATLGDVSQMSGPTKLDLAPPELPAPEDCIFDADFAPRFASRVEMRMHPDDVRYMTGEPTGTMQIRGWFRLHDDEPIDSFGLVCAGDAFPPTIFNAGLPPTWTPTLEYTAHVRRRAAAGWLACSIRTRALDNGFLEEDSEIWDCEGHLVAQTRQLALVGKS